MGSRATKYDLDNVTDYIQFEFFGNNLMSAEGYKNIEPLGGHNRSEYNIKLSTSINIALLRSEDKSLLIGLGFVLQAD